MTPTALRALVPITVLAGLAGLHHHLARSAGQRKHHTARLLRRVADRQRVARDTHLPGCLSGERGHPAPGVRVATPTGSTRITSTAQVGGRPPG